MFSVTTFPRAPKSFSALQRAENSSIQHTSSGLSRVLVFQCSSASRKFLNSAALCALVRASGFQCSSASRKFLNQRGIVPSVRILRVSVLFSEPKIPQSANPGLSPTNPSSFSALQRAENSSIVHTRSVPTALGRFQCSSASRKFLNFTWAQVASLQALGFSALQRAENSSMS